MAASDAGDREGIERIAYLEAALAERDARLTELTDQIAKLTEQIAKLTEVLGRNSRNSHLPPSSDGPGAGARSGSAGHSSRKSQRKRGGQKGHRGSYRELLPPERVDTIVNLFPEVCLKCGCALPRIVDVAACRYQQLELREHRRTSRSGAGTRLSVRDAGSVHERSTTALKSQARHSALA